MSEHVLSLSEIEVYISNLSTSKIDDLGDLSWFECHKRLHMLYQEALLETINGENEQVKEAVLLNGKMKPLVFEVISLSVWRHNIFPLLCAYDFDKEKVFPVFVMLYHEATAFGLVESLAFHADCVESLGDSTVELLDYCVACILQMINRNVPRRQAGGRSLSELSSRDELSHYEADVVHNLAVKAVSVLRFIAETFESLPLSIVSQFYKNHDVPMLLCKVIELEPWFTTDLDGKPHEFIDGQWRRRDRSLEDEALNKSAAQAWLSLRQVLLDPSFANHYELNDFRSRQLCKMVCHLHDEIIDQLSPLAELKHFLCRLSMASQPSAPPSRPLILELDAQFRDKLLKKYADKWDGIAKKQAKIVINLDIAQIQSLAQGLARAYETLDLVEPEPARCANCGDAAAKRCSRCKAEWYCGRECQVKMWDKHKVTCNTISEASQ